MVVGRKSPKFSQALSLYFSEQIISGAIFSICSILLILRLNANSFLVFWFRSFCKSCEQGKAGKQQQKGHTN